MCPGRCATGSTVLLQRRSRSARARSRRAAGEPALTPPDPVSWRIFKIQWRCSLAGCPPFCSNSPNRVSAPAFGTTTVSAPTGAAARRTGAAAMIKVYGARRQAEAMIAGVRRRHGAVIGTTPEGATYEANDPELLKWVQDTAGFGFLAADDLPASGRSAGTSRTAILPRVSRRHSFTARRMSRRPHRPGRLFPDDAAEARSVTCAPGTPRHHFERACHACPGAAIAADDGAGGRRYPAALGAQQLDLARGGRGLSKWLSCGISVRSLIAS